MFDDLFGGMFDFNGDGHTDFLEEATGFAVINNIMCHVRQTGFMRSNWTNKQQIEMVTYRYSLAV